MKTLRVKCLLLCFIMALVAASAQAEDRQQDHDELRQMLKTATDAMNSKNLDALAPLFYNKFSITTVDQKLFTNLADFKAYYEGLYSGDNAPLKKHNVQTRSQCADRIHRRQHRTQSRHFDRHLHFFRWRHSRDDKPVDCDCFQRQRQMENSQPAHRRRPVGESCSRYAKELCLQSRNRRWPGRPYRRICTRVDVERQKAKVKKQRVDGCPELSCLIS